MLVSAAMTKKTSSLKYYYDNLNSLNFTRWELSRLAMHHRKMKKEKYPIMCSNYAIHLENSSICEVNKCEAFELTFERDGFFRYAISYLASKTRCRRKNKIYRSQLLR